MSKHTPGPWKFDIGHARQTEECFILRGQTELVATIPIYKGISNYKANANLIAAAPELLKACKAIFETTESGVLKQTLSSNACKEAFVNDLMKLIAKAEGK